jgi:hypothetical protein
VVCKPDVNASTTNRSKFVYDVAGHLQAVSIADGRARTVTYVTSAEGQVLRRQETDTNAQLDAAKARRVTSSREATDRVTVLVTASIGPRQVLRANQILHFRLLEI